MIGDTLQIGDPLGVLMKDGTRQEMYLEDGPYEEDGNTWLTAADENGEVHAIVWYEYDSTWTQGE